MNLHPVLGLLAAIFAFHSPAHATSFAIQKFSSFVNETPFIARGEIHNIHVENGITGDGQKTIYTYATLEIKEVLKGSIPGAEVQIRRTGGTKDGFTLEVPGTPEFATGEDTLLFLGRPQEDQSYEIASLELGKFGLEPSGDDYKLTGGLLAYSAQSKDPNVKPSPEILENSKPWTLSQVRDLARGEVPVEGADPSRVASTNENGNIKDGRPPEESPKVVSPEANSSPTAIENRRPADVIGNIFKFCFAAVIAIGIFFFFKKRR